MASSTLARAAPDFLTDDRWNLQPHTANANAAQPATGGGLPVILDDVHDPAAALKI